MLDQLTIHQEDELANKLKSKPSLRIKYGIDPTAAHVHLGHSVGLLKLRQLQKQGHKPILIIGDFTAQIGDPTGRDETRPRLSCNTILDNSKEYLKQIAKIIDLDKSEIHYNGSWFSEMNFSDVVSLASNATVSQMLERNDFSNRIKSGNPVFMHELLYPIMQAYDSVMVNADVELGGTEQLFNLMLARDFQKIFHQEPQVCATVPILRGTDGKKRMGKSLGNYIGLDESPDSMFAKTMSIPDELMEEWWKLLPLDETKWMDAVLEIVDNMLIKKALACRIIRYFHSDGQAKEAAKAWYDTVSLKKDPENIPEVLMKAGKIWICKLLVDLKLCASNNQARRLIAPQFPKIGGSGVNIGENRRIINDPTEDVLLSDGLVVRVGNRKIAKIKL